MKRAAEQPETGEHITITRRTSRAELSSGNATLKFALDNTGLADLSFSEPLTKLTSSTRGLGLNSRKNSAVGSWKLAALSKSMNK